MRPPVWVLCGRFGDQVIRPDWRGVRRRLRPFVVAALPIAATGGVSIVYERIDLLLVSKLDDVEATAIYAVALQALQYTNLLPAVVTTAFFPLLAANLRDDPEQGRLSVILLARIFLFLSVPLMIVLVVCGEPLVTLVLGDRYADAATPVAIVSGSMVLGFLNYLFWNALLAAYQERAKLKIMLVALPVNIALNVALIPRVRRDWSGHRAGGVRSAGGGLAGHGGRSPRFSHPLCPHPHPPGDRRGAGARSGTGGRARPPPCSEGSWVSRSTRCSSWESRYVTAEEWRPLTEPVLRPGRTQAGLTPRRASSISMMRGIRLA